MSSGRTAAGVILLGAVVAGLCAGLRTPLEVAKTTTSAAASKCMPREEKTTVITVHYNERHPYLITARGGVEGLTGTPAALAFEKVNIPFKWAKTPSNRQIMILKGSEGLHCLAGWFKTAERETFAKYTRPIYRDQPQIALARMDNERVAHVVSVDTILADKSLVLGVKDGYSYGAFLDGKIAHHKPTVDRTTAENINMLRKVHRRRNDYFFVAPEEAAGLIESSGLPASDFRWIKFDDMAEGESRHILCGRNVGDEVIEKLNSTISGFVHLQ